jgi:hypothetical protein
MTAGGKVSAFFAHWYDATLPVEVAASHLLSPAYPNPFNPVTQFTLAVSADQQVTVRYSTCSVAGSRCSTKECLRRSRRTDSVLRRVNSPAASISFGFRVSGSQTPCR